MSFPFLEMNIFINFINKILKKDHEIDLSIIYDMLYSLCILCRTLGTDSYEFHSPKSYVSP